MKNQMSDLRRRSQVSGRTQGGVVAIWPLSPSATRNVESSCGFMTVACCCFRHAGGSWGLTGQSQDTQTPTPRWRTGHGQRWLLILLFHSGYRAFKWSTEKSKLCSDNKIYPESLQFWTPLSFSDLRTKCVTKSCGRERQQRIKTCISFKKLW